MVVMVLLNTSYTAAFEVHYDTEAQCIRQKANYQSTPGSTRKARCVSLDTTTIREITGNVARHDLQVLTATGNFAPVPGHVIPD